MEDKNFNEEFNQGAEASNETMAGTEATPKDVRIYHDAEGNEISQAQFIRDKFTNENLSRKEISEMFDIPYRTVYQATVNMVNSAAPTSRGRSAVASKIQVTAADEVLMPIDGKYLLNGVEVAADALPETTEVNRNEWIKRVVAEAKYERADVAKFLGTAYGTIYAITKGETEGSRTKHEVTLPDGTTVSRNEYIRMLAEQGKPKSEIAKELDVPYQIVYQATKVEKTAAERYTAAIDALEKFADDVIDEHKDFFTQTVESLRQVGIKVEEVKEAAPAEGTSEAAPAAE